MTPDERITALEQRVLDLETLTESRFSVFQRFAKGVEKKLGIVAVEGRGIAQARAEWARRRSGL